MIPAVILCGVLGTRLQGVLSDRPKCLAPIGERTYLDILTDHLHSQGIKEFIFATGYRHDQVEAWLRSEDRPWTWTISLEDTPLGTGGALRLAAQKVTHHCFLAFNGDTFLDLDCVALAAHHEESGAQVTLAAIDVSDTSAFGRLFIKDGQVVSFQEKGIAGSGLINGGAYTIDKQFIASQPEGPLSLEKDVLPHSGVRTAVFVTRGRFLDIGTPKNLAEASSWALK